MDVAAQRVREQPAAGQHVAQAVHLCGPAAGLAPVDAPLDRGGAYISRPGEEDARVQGGTERRRAAAPAPGDPQGHGRPGGVSEPLQVGRDGIRTAGSKDAVGLLGGCPVEAPGSGGQDTGGREYAEVLESGGDAEDAYVDLRLRVDQVYDSIRCEKRRTLTVMMDLAIATLHTILLEPAAADVCITRKDTGYKLPPCSIYAVGRSLVYESRR